uniref:Uncharacterized protein n=1 Tax=Arabis nemorensis TaxID=586526 RepID=A0A565AXT2_9BRAS
MASPRTGVKSFKDLSPARKRLAMNDTLSPEPEDKVPTNPWRRRYHSLSPQRSFQIIKDEQKTGLISGKDIGSEYRKKKEDEQLRFKKMDSELTGQNAEAVFRDKITGKRISTEEYLKSKPEKLVQELEWCKGLAQEREAEARLHELELEKAMPFARTRVR